MITFSDPPSDWLWCPKCQAVRKPLLSDIDEEEGETCCYLYCEECLDDDFMEVVRLTPLFKTLTDLERYIGGDHKIRFLVPEDADYDGDLSIEDINEQAVYEGTLTEEGVISEAN